MMVITAGGTEVDYPIIPINISEQSLVLSMERGGGSRARSSGRIYMNRRVKNHFSIKLKDHFFYMNKGKERPLFVINQLIIMIYQFRRRCYYYTPRKNCDARMGDTIDEI